MADILIRIEKPKNCFLCRFFREIQDYDGTFCCCIAAKKEISWDFDDCLFPSLPEGHGRLIDADALDRAFTDLRFNSDGTLNHWGDRPGWCMHGYEVEKLIADAPTIVPAEGGKDDG